MKLYMAEGAFGGFKWISDYYALQDPDWTKIAASGLIDDAASQKNGNTYAGSINYREVSFDTVDPDLKPVGQREISFGVEKKLMEDLSLSARFVQKHLIRTIEDVGVYVIDPRLIWLVKFTTSLTPALAGQDLNLRVENLLIP